MQGEELSSKLRVDKTCPVFKRILKVALLAAIASTLLLFLARDFPVLIGGIDFPDFYCAGVMTREHIALYDPVAQQECQTREARRQATFYIHPPFEALLFAPFSELSLKNAYLLWNLLNCVILGLAIRELTRTLAWQWDWALIAGISFIFPPLLLNFLQGQDAVLLFAVVVFSFSSWVKKKYLRAGILLALGLFRFHLVVPLAILLAIRGRWRFAGGFCCTGMFLSLISSAYFGWHIFTDYARFLQRLPQLPMSGVHWRAMGNVRGLVGFFALGDTKTVLAVIGFTSILLLAIGAWTWIRSNSSDYQDRLAYGASVLIALLVGYHLSPHDLALLLLPMAVVLDAAGSRTRILRWSATSLVLVLFLPPLHAILLAWKCYALMSLFVLALIVTTLKLAGTGERPSAISEAVMP